MRLSSGWWLIWLRGIFLLSGFTGLLFEVLWTRQLSNVVGATSVAMTCIFSTFVFCLALGALLASRVRLMGRPALLCYAALEVAIGTSGLALTLLLLHQDVWLAGWMPLQSGSRSIIVDLIYTFLLIGPPTTLMGATLPVLMNGVRAVALPSREVALIYGMNVIGGALGALACGFVLVWKLGVTGTALFALGLASLVALSAVVLAFSAGAVEERPPSLEAWEPQNRLELPLYGLLAFLCGGFALVYELLWGRIAKLYLGDRTLATATLLFVYLLCMAAGSFAVQRLFARRGAVALPENLTRFANMLAVAAATHLLALSLVVMAIDSPALADLLSRRAWPRVLMTLAAIMVPVCVLGMAFPLLLQSARQLDALPARAVGRLYFVNSIGAGIGAVLGGYLLPRSVGTLNGFLLSSVFMLATAAVCHLVGFGSARRRLQRVGLAAVLLLVSWVVMPGDLLFYDPEETLVATNEDEYGIQVVTSDAEGHLKVKNNRIFIAYKLGAYSTSFTQEMIAYFSCLLAERCDQVLNIGTGYGITAGAFTQFEEVSALRTIEMLPYVCRIQPTFERFNFAYYADPRVEQLCTDGRRVLAAERRRWDVISVNVLDPYLPGSSGLFTTDFWKLASRRLEPGGVYSQLIWGADRELLVRGLETVFERVLLFPAYKRSHNVIALQDDREPVLHLERITPGIRKALRRLGIEDPEAFFERALAHALAMEESRRVARGSVDREAVLHTDDRPILEYRWSQGDRRISIFDSLQAFED